MQSPVLSLEQFARAREDIQQRRRRLESEHAASLQALDAEEAEIDATEKQVRDFLAKYGAVPNGAAKPPEPRRPRPQPLSGKATVLAAVEALDAEEGGSTRFDIAGHIQRSYGQNLPDSSITT